LEQEQRGEAEDQREEVEQAERAVSASRTPLPMPPRNLVFAYRHRAP
jgi:hypothetical protein